MIELMKGLPENVIGMTAKGQVSGDDYEQVVIPAVEDALKTHDKIRVLYHLGPDFEGYDAAALWDDAKVGMEHLTHFDKIAIITDAGWITNMVKAFGFLMPCKVKLFGNHQLAQARVWIAE